MIELEEFWKNEFDSLLMDKNEGYLSLSSSNSMIERVELFKDIIEDKLGTKLPPTPVEDYEDEVILRLLEVDAERTFKTQKFREMSITTLKTICSHTKDYHQGMGFITSFLLLFCDPTQTSSIILAIDKYYIPGYFKSLARNYFRDAKVFGKILKIMNTEAYNYIEPNNIPPETYCSKWFVGLNVHVLPFEALLLFLEFFLKRGDDYLFCFGLSLINNCLLDLSETNDISKILAILRLDPKFYPSNMSSFDNYKKGSFFTKIVEDALNIELKDIDIEKLRNETELEMAADDEKRKKREEELALLSDDEIIFSDEE